MNLQLLKRMLFAVVLGRGLLAFRQIALIPVLLHYWGVKYYGEWLLVSAVPTFLGMTNLGIGTSASLYIASKQRQDNVQDAYSAFSTAQILILGIGLIVLFAVYQARDLFFFSEGLSALSNPGEVLLILVATLFVQMLGTPLSGWWIGKDKASLSYNFNNFLSLSVLIISIAVPIQGGTAYSLAVSLFIATLVWLIFYFGYTFKNLKLSVRNCHFSKKAVVPIVSTGVGHQLSALWQAIYFQGSIILAGMALGPEGAAAWGTLRVISRVGNQACELISQSLAPSFVTSISDNNISEIRRLHAFGILGSATTAAVAALLIAALGPFLLQIWTKTQISAPSSAWIFMSLSLIPYSLWWLSGELQRSANKPWKLNVIGTISATVSLAAMYVGKKNGLTSFSFGSFLFELLMLTFAGKASLDIMKVSLREHLTDIKIAFLASMKFASSRLKT